MSDAFMTTDPATKATTLPLAATITKHGRGYGGQYTARLGDLTATASSAREARQGLADRLTAAVTDGPDTSPAFALDDDGALIVVTPEPDGDVRVWRVKDRQARCIGRGEGPPEVVIDRTHHYRRLPTE